MLHPISETDNQISLPYVPFVAIGTTGSERKMEKIRVILSKIDKKNEVTKKSKAPGLQEKDNNNLVPENLPLIYISGLPSWMEDYDCISAYGNFWTSKLNSSNKEKQNIVFYADSVIQDIPKTELGIQHFLSNIFANREAMQNGSGRDFGISYNSIRQLVLREKDKTIELILKDPEILVSLSSDRERAGKRIIDEWHKRTKGVVLKRELEALLSDKKNVEKIIKRYSPDELENLLNKNPWEISKIDGLGIEFADKIAAYYKVNKNSHDRLKGIIVDFFKKEANEGSTGVPMYKVTRVIEEHKEIKIDDLAELVKKIFNEDDDDISLVSAYAKFLGGLKNLCIAEYQINNHIKRRAVGEFGDESNKNFLSIKKIIEDLFQKQEFSRFDETQRKAVILAGTAPIGIITGGPGTGKSTIMQAASELCESLSSAPLILAAPTGKAAKRLEETTQRKAMTVHRLLKARMDEKDGTTFQVNERSQLASGTVVIVDEASMLDSETAAALIKAMPDDGRLIFVGDKYQLPSVGPGAVLENLLEKNKQGGYIVPVVELEKVYRQSNDSAIAHGAACIKNGEMPDLPDHDINGVSFIEANDGEIGDIIERIVCETLEGENFDPINDVAILSPQTNDFGGTSDINQRLSYRLNEQGRDINPNKKYDNISSKMSPTPRIGDRVMVTFNDYERDVMNGDTGIILRAEPDEKKIVQITIKLDDGREVKYPESRLPKIILAYAQTIHKAQGSQYPVVIMPIAKSHKEMLEKRLIYTGWTRAKTKLILVGDKNAFRAGIENKGKERVTFLSVFLRQKILRLSFQGIKIYTEHANFHKGQDVPFRRIHGIKESAPTINTTATVEKKITSNVASDGRDIKGKTTDKTKEETNPFNKTLAGMLMQQFDKSGKDLWEHVMEACGEYDFTNSNKNKFKK